MTIFTRAYDGTQPVRVEQMHGNTFNGEDGAHQFIITGVPTGPVMAYMMRANGTTCTVDGTNADDTATVTLNQDCYNVPGRFTLSIFVGDTGARVCVYACVGTVYRTRTNTIIDSGDVVPSLDDVIAMYDDVRAATEAAKAVVDEVSGLISKTAPAIVDTASGAVASFDDGADGILVQKLIVNIEPVQAGSGDPSPDNVRPISGWTGAAIERTGINVWDEKWENGYINLLGGLVNDSKYIRSKNYIMVAPGTSYYCKSNGHLMYVFQYDSNKQFISDSRAGYTDRVITVRQDCHYIKFNMSGTYGGTYNNDLAINYPSTATSYKPYTGDQISVAFPSSAGTIYQGTATYNGDGTWTILSEYAFFDEWALLTRGTVNNDGTGRIFNRSFSAFSKFTYGTKMISNVLKAVNNPGSWERLPRSSFVSNMATYFVICTNDPDDTTETMLNWAANVQLLMKLKTPVQATVTTEQLLTTLYGTNNVWSDAGDTAIDYVADTKLYIEKLTQPTEDDMTADHLITNGTFFMVGNSLYLATAQIAAGATITPGTNATKLSLADALNTLNS